MAGTNPYGGNTTQPVASTDPTNPNGTYNFMNVDPTSADAGAGALSNDLAWLTSNPSLMSRSLMRQQGFGGSQYTMDPYSQWLQNRALAASTLSTYFSPSTSPDNMLASAGQYAGALNPGASNATALSDAWKKAAGWVNHVMGSAPVAGDLSQSPSGAGIGLPDYLSGTVLGGNPQVVSQLMSAVAAGLPTPISDAVNNMMGRLYAQYQDLSPGLAKGQAVAPSFFSWLGNFM